MLVDGKPVHASHYFPGSTHTVSVTPRNASAGRAAGKRGMVTKGGRAEQTHGTMPTWFLLDAGVGTFSLPPDQSGPPPGAWNVMCSGTRVAFKSTGNVPVPVRIQWTAPLDYAGGGLGGGVLLRVAAATSMGNISINAAVLQGRSISNYLTWFVCPMFRMGLNI